MSSASLDDLAFKVSLILIGCQRFYNSSSGKKNDSESDTKDIFLYLCCRYSCGVDALES